MQQVARLRNPVICLSALMILWNQLVRWTRQIRRTCWPLNMKRLYEIKASWPLRRLKTVAFRSHYGCIDSWTILNLDQGQRLQRCDNVLQWCPNE